MTSLEMIEKWRRGFNDAMERKLKTQGDMDSECNLFEVYLDITGLIDRYEKGDKFLKRLESDFIEFEKESSGESRKII